MVQGNAGVREAVPCLNPSKSSERGSVLAEFVMVAPVMLLIAGSALRFYQELQAQQIGLTFAREVATLAYSRCIDKTHTTIGLDSSGQEQVTGDPTKTLNQIGECVRGEVIEEFSKNWDNVKPVAADSTGVIITVKAYRCDIDKLSTTTCDNKGEVLCTSSAGSTASCGEPRPNASQPILTAARNRLVVATIQFSIAPLVPFIPSIKPRSITYEATI